MTWQQNTILFAANKLGKNPIYSVMQGTRK